jgi:diguanylate cyclase (GGDEF)-like protein/putative nucleotidyltransferase with HDIG domain
LTVWALIPLITSVSYVILLILSLPSIARRANRVFALYLAIAALWSFTSFMLHLSASPAQSLVWNELLVIALVWTLVAYYHFIRVYTSQRGGRSVYLGYALLAVLAFFTLRGDVVKSASVDHGILTNHFGFGAYLLACISVAFIVAVMVHLIDKYRRSVDPVDRNRTTYLVAGWAVLVVLTYTNLIASLSRFPLDHIGSLINALIITYAISRLRLLDIKFLLRRGLVYLLIVAALGGIYAGVIYLGQNVFPGQPTYVTVLVAALLIILITILARPMRQVAQEGIDRLFYRDTYTYRKALLSFSTGAGTIIDLNQLADQMLPTVSAALRITQAKLMFQLNGGGDFATQFSFPKSNEKDTLTFGLDSPLIALLQKDDEPVDLKQVDTIPQLKGLWQEDREKLARSGLEFLYPIKSRGHLIGILGLGKKKSAGLYLAEDIELIKSMTGQAGIIVDNARVYSQAMTWANTDATTELYNHRHFHERMDQEIARGSRFGSIFSLVMMDLDHFKTYNDNYGHLAGDEVLRKVGRCIEGSIRSVDMAFRYGGEEFTVILPGTRLNDAYKVAERIRNTIEAKASPGTMPVTASLGVSSWPIDGMTKQDIIARADAALYQAKQSGRNRVMLSSEVVRGQTSLIGLELETKERALSIIYALAATVDAKDHYTYGHSKKVSQYAVMMAEALGLSTEKVATIRAAGLLHDIGKIAVPDSILNKAGPLTEEEWEPIKAHPELGMEILKHVIDLVNCLPGILHHHEHYDGTGYPGALKGEEIPLEARVLAIADVYDAITSMRPYRNQMTPQEALDELRRCAGTQFDPELIKLFCRTVESNLPNRLQVE